MVVVEHSSILEEKNPHFLLFWERWIAFVSGTKMGTNALIPGEEAKVLNIVSILMTLLIYDVPVLSYLF